MGYELEMTEYTEQRQAESTAAQLREVLAHTQESMREAVMNGDGEKLIELDNQIRSLGARIFSADVAETKAAIDAAEQGKIDSKKRMELLTEYKRGRNMQLLRAIKLYEARLARVQAAEVAVQMEESRYHQTLATRRELRAKLENLLKAKQAEQEKMYEQFRY